MRVRIEKEKEEGGRERRAERLEVAFKCTSFVPCIKESSRKIRAIPAGEVLNSGTL
jgi:hypothetical protein